MQSGFEMISTVKVGDSVYCFYHIKCVGGMGCRHVKGILSWEHEKEIVIFIDESYKSSENYEERIFLHVPKDDIVELWENNKI